jgi:hypothetical protein
MHAKGLGVSAQGRESSCAVILTRLSSVASKEFSLALLAHLPCDAGSQHPVSRLAIRHCMMPSNSTTDEGSNLQEGTICQVDNGVGRREGGLTHNVYACSVTAIRLASGRKTLFKVTMTAEEGCKVIYLAERHQKKILVSCPSLEKSFDR